MNDSDRIVFHDSVHALRNCVGAIAASVDVFHPSRPQELIDVLEECIERMTLHLQTLSSLDQSIRKQEADADAGE